MAAVAVFGGALSTLGIVAFGTLFRYREHPHASTTAAASSLPVSLLQDSSDYTQPWVSNRAAQDILTYLHASYPLILLFFFLTAFTVRSITTSRTEEEDDDQGSGSSQLGPGGKALLKKTPLHASKRPQQDILDFSRPRKLLFEWLSLAAALTFVGNAITIVSHALYARSEEWWCGQAAVVSLVIWSLGSGDILTLYRYTMSAPSWSTL